MNSAATELDTSLYTYMVRDHASLDTLYGRVLEAMAGTAQHLEGLWTDFDHHLRSHMDAEERFVMPALAKVDRLSALMLLREHGQIREEMLELGVACNLHELRFARSRELIEQLRSHAARENSLLYRWADKHLDLKTLTATMARATSRD